MFNFLIKDIIMYSIEELTSQQLLNACIYFVFVIVVPAIMQLGDWIIIISLINLLMISLIYIPYLYLFLISVIEILVGIWISLEAIPDIEN